MQASRWYRSMAFKIKFEAIAFDLAYSPRTFEGVNLEVSVMIWP